MTGLNSSSSSSSIIPIITTTTDIKGKSKLNKDKVKSQRPSFSCTECSRRKIRCDKVIPCKPCTLRGTIDICHLSSVDSRPNLPIASSSTRRLPTLEEMDNIRKSVGDLRQQLLHLETVVSSFTPVESTSQAQNPYSFNNKFIKQQSDEIDELDQNNFVDNTQSQASSSKLNSQLNRVREREETQLPDSDGEVEAATTLEFLALGRDRKQDHIERSGLRRPESPYSTSNNNDLLYTPSALPLTHPIAYAPEISSPEILPPKELSDAIVRYALENFGFHFGGVVNISVFENECEEFYNWGDRRFLLVNKAWLGLYYAILCVGVKHMSFELALEWSITTDDLKNLPKQFFDASVRSLHRADFLSKHSIFSIQTIAILVTNLQDVGGSDLIATLLATGIRIAQHLNLHRFGSDLEWQARRISNGVDPASEIGVKALIDREIRKRIWCSLTNEDWLSVAYRRSYAIFPMHCTTPLPLNCHDSDLLTGQMISRPVEEVTTVTKLLLSWRIASCVREFFDGMNTSDGLSYDLCLKVDREIRETIRAAPKVMREGADLTNESTWVKLMAHYWLMSSNHKLLIIHRTYLGRKNSKYEYSKNAAIEAAKQILYEFPRGTLLPYQDLWTSIYHAVAASTTILMDLFQHPSATPSTDLKNLVETSLQQLAKLTETSSIAARGVQLLSSLLAEASAHRRAEASKSSGGGGSGSKRKRSNLLGAEEESFGKVAKKVANNNSSNGNHQHSHNQNSQHISSASSSTSNSNNSRSPSNQLQLPLLPYYPSIPSPNSNAFDSLLSSSSFSYGTGVEFAMTGENDLEFWRLLEGFETPSFESDHPIVESGTWSS